MPMLMRVDIDAAVAVAAERVVIDMMIIFLARAVRRASGARKEALRCARRDDAITRR